MIPMKYKCTIDPSHVFEVATEDCDEFINAVKFLGPTWGGINLEDIRAPECFIIESFWFIKWYPITIHFRW